jgi:hypothetical protein
MITRNPSQLKTILEKLELANLAESTGFALRQSRKIDPASLVTSFFEMMIIGKYSLRLWAIQLSGLVEDKISFQAIAKKLDYRKLPFFQALFQKALMAKIKNRLDFEVHTMLESFRRVVIEDSTCFKLPKALFDFFPGARMPHGRMAGGRLQLRMDLKGNAYDAISLKSYCQNDCSFSDDVLHTLKKGELVIRDLGYWSIPVFGQIIKRGAYFLSRLHLTVSVLKADNQQVIDLAAFLKQKEQMGIMQVDLQVLLSDKHRLPVRLVAIKLTDEQAEKRRRMAKAQRHKVSPISKKSYYLMSWNLFVTNVPNETWDAPTVYRVYNLRWHIEMIFKCWKSNFNFNDFFKHCKGRNPVKPEIIILLLLTWFVLVYVPKFNQYATTIWKKYKRILSPMRFAVYMSVNMEQLLCNQAIKLIPIMAYYCCYDKRKDRKTHFEKLYMNFLS